MPVGGERRGLNPLGCAQACAEALQKAGCRPMKIGVVSGDDVVHLLREAAPTTEVFRNLDSGRSLGDVQDRLVTANAYIGSTGICAALQQGAEIVITGRIADPSMVVGPCMFEFGWKEDEWDRLAGATVAGHLMECGTHVTGGIATDWLSLPDPLRIPFPLVEVDSDGDCVVTKPANTGGKVTLETVKEQLIYEIGDPHQYLSPDVTVSFLDLVLVEDGKDRVRVTGAKGRERPKTLKVSATYRDGYRAAGMLTIFGADAVAKARRSGAVVLRRLAEQGCQYRDTLIECLGNGESVPVICHADVGDRAYETVLRVAVEADTKEPVEKFARELMPLVTAGAQGTTGYAEGRPKVHSVFRYWPCLIENDRAPYRLEFITSSDGAANATATSQVWPPAKPVPASLNLSDGLVKAPARMEGRLPTLADRAFGRSGDKGTGANIGILAKSDQDFAWLKEWLTAEKVQAYFAPIGIESVTRVEFAALKGFNFLIRGILRRGIRNDAQGKALAQALLAMRIDE